MIKVSVLYPADGGTTFDHDYYKNKHMPLIKERLGDACLSYAIDRGIAGRDPGSAAPFIAACHIFADSLDSFQAAFSPHAAEITGDVTNYTDIIPLMQISEVIDG